MVARDCLGQQQQQLCVLCQASAWSHSPPCLQSGERHQKVVQSTGIWSQAMCEPWAARLLWALCACHFIARLQVTPLILALRFEMAEPHRNAQAGGIPQGLRLRAVACQPCRQSSSGPWRWVWVGACPGCSGAGAVGACCRWRGAPALWQHQRWESLCSRDTAKCIWQEQKHSMLNVLSQTSFALWIAWFFPHKPPNKHQFGT